MPKFRMMDTPVIEFDFVCNGIEEEKARRALEAVARAMSRHDKLMLLNRWDRHEHAPLVEFVATQVFTKDAQDRPCRALGMNVTVEGLAFRFAGHSMDLMSDILAETVIAHEFAHPLIYLDVQNNCLTPVEKAIYDTLPAEGQPILDWTEAAVSRRIAAWNGQYDDQAPREWLQHFLDHGEPPSLYEPDVDGTTPSPDTGHEEHSH